MSLKDEIKAAVMQWTSDYVEYHMSVKEDQHKALQDRKKAFKDEAWQHLEQLLERVVDIRALELAAGAIPVVTEVFNLEGSILIETYNTSYGSPNPGMNSAEYWISLAEGESK